MTVGCDTDDVRLATLTFVQRVQELAGTWAAESREVAYRKTWEVLVIIPRTNDKLERGVIIAVLERICSGLLFGRKSENRIHQVTLEDPRALRILDVFSQRAFDRQFNLQVLADEIGCSRWHASHILKERLGWRFVSHLNGIRVLYAVQLLRTTRLAIHEVAGSCGYRCVSELDRNIHRLIGMTPREIRAAPVIRVQQC